MGLPRITYGVGFAKTINLPYPPIRPIVEPVVPRAVNVSLTGVVETILQARCDLPIRFQFGERGLTVAMRRQFDNLDQWLQQGNTCTLALDSAKTVSTTLVASEAVGETVIGVTGGTGTVDGQQYVLKGGPNYQLVNISSGGGTGTITLDSSLDYTFAAGSVFRDRYYWTLIFRDDRAKIQIRDIADTQNPDSFDVTIEAYEVAT